MGRETDQVRAGLMDRRVKLGVDRRSLAARAGVDRGTLKKAEETTDDVSPATIGAIDAALTALEEELGMDVELEVSAYIEVGEMKIRLRGTPEEVAATVRKISQGGVR